MMFRKPSHLGRLLPAAQDNSRFSDSLMFDGAPRDRTAEWRAAAGQLARRLMPVMVLAAAAVLGLAAVAMA